MLKLSSGKSDVDRITFYDSKYGATAIRKDDGEIKIEYETNNVTISQILIVFGLFLGISLFKAFAIMPFIDNQSNMVYLYLIPAVIYFLLMLAVIKGMREKGNEILRNHGAEHMVFSAYKKLKRIPTIEETKKFSRINKNCGIWIFSAFITAQLIGFGAYKFANYQIPEWILYVVPLLIGSYFPFNVMGKIAQFWTTSKPNDQNIELAISALCALEKRNLISDLANSLVNELFKRF